MAEAFIPRRKADGDELDFERLRGEAIELIEQVSGKQWTDYNLHDPGITILEQLIYAITDLGYRCEFAIQDYLADASGDIDLEAQALHEAAEIYCCRPTTPEDYRKLLLNALPEIDNLWLGEMTGPNGERGLYRLSVKLQRELAPGRRRAIVDEICRVYRAARNLCEDLGQPPVVVENREYELCAAIEVSSARYPAEILAQIYFDCARRIASGAKVTTYDQIEPGERDLERLFDGPFTERGFYGSDDDHQRASGFPITALFATINRIAGVDQIQLLYLSRGGEDIYDRIEAPGDDAAFDLAIPRGQQQIGVELTTNGRKLRISFADFWARYQEISFKHYASRRRKQDLSMLYRPVEASARPLRQYFSVQNQFPASYGVNRLGVPESASPDVKGRVRQLKAYLLIFEQFLVNFLANLDSLDLLFSPRTGALASYATGVVDARQVSDLEAVYPPEAERVFAGINSRFDNFYERKNRVLDYLLALYGERFNQHSLRQFNYYHARDEVDSVILANKVKFLENIVSLGRDRGAAPDYRSNDATAISGLARRVSLLLGFAQPERTVAAIEACGLGLCSDDEYRRVLDAGSPHSIDAGELDGDRYSQPPSVPVDTAWSARRLRDELDEVGDIAALGSGQLGESLLRHGIDISRYRTGRDADAGKFRLYFRYDDRHYWLLGEPGDEDAAVLAANYLRRLLLLLNRDSEGVHIVEHLMLRPRQEHAAAVGGDFYSFRVSAVLPAWTTRCSDRDFRNLARETLRLNAPAHVYVEFFWFGYEQMQEFERAYRAWLDGQRDAAAVDRSARTLVDLLRDARAAQADETWLPA